MEKIEYAGIITEEMYKLAKELIDNGKLDEYRYLIDDFSARKEQLLSMMESKPEEVYMNIIKNYLKEVDGIAKLTPGLTTAIKDNKSGVEIYTYSGKTSDKGTLVDENTRFDIASITKLFTTIEALKLAEDNKFNLDKNVSTFNGGKYKSLKIPVSKMAKFYYELRTDGRLDERDEILNLEELDRRLASTNSVKDRTFIYSDIPYIILKDILPDSDKYFKQYFNEELQLLNTSYDNHGVLTGGSEDNLNIVHDPKARAFSKYGINTGHAGLFSTSEDLVKLFDGLANGFLSEDSIKDMITPAIENQPVLLDENGNIEFKKNAKGEPTGVYNISRGMDVYIRHPEGLRVNELVKGLSTDAFSAAGFTGSYATFDLKNGLTANILANPLSSSTEKEIIIDNEAYTIKDCGKTFAPGTKFKVCGKKISVLGDNGETIDQPAFTRITNTLKEGQIYTLLALRLAKNALTHKAMIEQDNSLYKETLETFENKNSFRR